MEKNWNGSGAAHSFRLSLCPLASSSGESTECNQLNFLQLRTNHRTGSTPGLRTSRARPAPPPSLLWNLCRKHLVPSHHVLPDLCSEGPRRAPECVSDSVTDGATVSCGEKCVASEPPKPAPILTSHKSSRQSQILFEWVTSGILRIRRRISNTQKAS
jgi:hypothetical protein